MYEVKLTEAEVRAIISAYDDANLYLKEVCKGWDDIHGENLISEILEPARTSLASRINYFENKLDMGH